MIPPDLLAELKAFLGIEPGDTTADAWLTGESEIVLAAMRQATGRWLYPPAVVDDAFGVPHDPCAPCAPACGFVCGPVQVKELPATEVLAVRQDGADLDPAAYELDPLGTLRTKADRQAVAVPATGWLAVEYQAGYAVLPAELKAALFNIVGAAWNASGQGAVAGILPVGVSKVSIIDVGAVEMPDAVGFAGAAAADPILGRYGVLLTPYVDMAAQLGANPCRISRVTPPVALARGTPKLALVTP
jgi:hypothetical protein